MAYKYSKGAQVIGDLKAADDAERNTLIDFGEDQIEFQTSGSTRLKVDNDGTQITGSLKVTNLGPENEIVIVGTDNALTSSNLLTIDSNNQRVGIGTSSPSVKLDMVGEASGETQIRMAQHNSDSDAPDIRLFKSRGTEDSPTAVADNDNLARVNSFAYDGSSYVQAGSFGWNADGTDGDSIFDIRTRVANTTAARLTVNAEGGVDLTGDLDVDANTNVSGNLTVTGSITTTNDISFQDNNGTFPTNTAGFFWDLNNDEARIYAQQPASDDINFYFKLSDNNHSDDRFIFWIDDYQGGSHDRYPLVMHGSNIYMHSTETSEGVPDLSTAKINIPRGTTSATTTVHKGRVQLQGDNSSDLYIRFTQNSQNGYIFQDQSDSNALKVESHTHLSLNTNGANERLKIASAGDITFNQAYTFPTSDGTNGQVLQTDGAGNLSFASVSGGSGSTPGGSDRQVQFNDGGSLAGNSAVLVDGSYNLKLSSSLFVKEKVGIGIDLGGGRDSNDEWVAITSPQDRFHMVGDATDNAAFSVDQASNTVGGTYWSFSRARGTPSSPTAINANDEISRIQFFAHTGSSTLKRSAMIFTTADADGDGRMRFYTTHNGDANNIAMDLYDNKVEFGDQVVIGASGMNPISNGGASIGGASNRFENIQANNVFAYESFKVGSTHPIYDRGGHGISVNKDIATIGNYTSGEGFVYVSNYSSVENVAFVLRKTGSHFGGIAINGTDTDNDEKVVLFSENSTAGFVFKNSITDNGTNGMSNLETTGKTLMELDSTGNLNVPSGTLSVGAITIPNTDGTNGQVLQTDGSGNLSFATVSGGAASAGGPDGSIQINDSNSLTGSTGLTYDGTELYASGSVRIVGEEIINDPEYATTNQSNRSFTLKRHYNFSNVSANTWHDVISFQPYLQGTTNNPGANTFWASIGMKIEIAGHTSGVGNGYRSRTAYVSYNGSSADSGGSSDITLGTTNVSTRLNLSGWSTTVQINPDQVSATGFTGTVYVEIHFGRGAGSNGENVTWSVT